MPVLSEFVIIFFLFLAGYYFLPVGICYLLLSLRSPQKLASRKIQDRLPERTAIRREISWSVSSVLIFSIAATAVYQWIKSGDARLYYDWQEYGLLYLLVSPLLCIVLHDTYYYWIHRLMHHKKLFRYFHRVHHLSVTPTPWAIYAFQPAEALLSFLSFALLVLFLPLHPVAFALYMLVSLVNNIGGHCGYELLPAWIVRHPVLKYTTVVTFHDMHHTHVKYNFGAYFNIWDRLMKTMHRGYEKKFLSVSSHQPSKKTGHEPTQ